MTDYKFRALLIGNWDYRDSENGLQQLKGARNDPRHLHKALTHPDFGLFHEEEVRVKENLTGMGLSDELFQFVNTAGPEDVLLIYFSGHGERVGAQRLGFCGVDVTDLTRETRCFWSTALSDWLRIRNRAKSTIVVLDCCYSGEFKGTLQGEVFDSFGTDTVVLSSGGNESTKDASSEEDSSPFTAALIDVLTDPSLDGDANGFVSTLTVSEKLLRYQPALKPAPKIVNQLRNVLPIAKRPQPLGPEPTSLLHWVKTQEIDPIDVVFDGQTVMARFGDEEEPWDLAEFDGVRQATVRRLGCLADVVARLPHFEDNKRLHHVIRRTWSCAGANLFATAMPARLRDRITGDLDSSGQHVLKIRLIFRAGAEHFETYPWEYLGCGDGGAAASHGADRPLALHRGVLVERVPPTGGTRVARSQSPADTGSLSVAVINSFVNELKDVGERVAKDLADLGRVNLVFERHGPAASWSAFLDMLDQRPRYLVLFMPLRRFGRGVGELGFASRRGDDPHFRLIADVLAEVRAAKLTFDGVVIVSFAGAPSEDAFRGIYEVAAAVAQAGHTPVAFVCHTRGYEPDHPDSSFPTLLLNAVSRGEGEFDRCFWYARSQAVRLDESEHPHAFGVPGFYGEPSPAEAPSPSGAGSSGFVVPRPRPGTGMRTAREQRS
ncbi:MAG: caspase family protein [Pseudonocardiales bacterium]|nr:caspase family protein [Pseudonocardiales bacterium]